MGEKGGEAVVNFRDQWPNMRLGCNLGAMRGSCENGGIVGRTSGWGGLILGLWMFGEIDKRGKTRRKQEGGGPVVVVQAVRYEGRGPRPSLYSRSKIAIRKTSLRIILPARAKKGPREGRKEGKGEKRLSGKQSRILCVREDSREGCPNLF